MAFVDDAMTATMATMAKAEVARATPWVARLILAVIAALSMLSANAGLFDRETDVEKQREKMQEARANALEKLYAEKPGVRDEIAGAKGYAVFSNIGVNLVLVSTQRGGGILRDNRNGSDTYMKMLSAGGGLGLGVKDFAAIFVFHTDAAFEGFAEEGWDFSAQADANLESGDKGEGMETAGTVMPGTTLYQVTDAGVAAQITLQGTKFWVDEALN